MGDERCRNVDLQSRDIERGGTRGEYINISYNATVKVGVPIPTGFSVSVPAGHSPGRKEIRN